MNTFKEIFISNISKYPIKIREALFSLNNIIFLKELTKEYFLGEKKELFFDLVGYVLIGLIDLNEFINQLEGELEIEPTKAGSLFREINKKIFFPLKEEILLASKISQDIGLLKKFKSFFYKSNDNQPKVAGNENKDILDLKVDKQPPKDVLVLKEDKNGSEENKEIREEIMPNEGNKKRKSEKRGKSVIDLNNSFSKEGLSKKVSKEEKEEVKKTFFPGMISFHNKQVPLAKSEKPEMTFAEKAEASSVKKPLVSKIEFVKQNSRNNSEKIIGRNIDNGPKFKEINYQEKESTDNKGKTFSNVIKLKK